MTVYPGKLIVIEGLEGAGKSSAIKTVVAELEKHQIQSLITREPGGTPVGEALRSILKNTDYKDVLDDKTELLLMYASRIQLCEEVIKPALQRGTWVIADRFELSTLAYQGGGRDLDEEMIVRLSSFCMQGLKPDLTLYLDITPEIGMQRAGARGTLDRIEQQSLDFFHKVHKTYLKYVQQDAHAVLLDANKTLPEVLHEIQSAIKKFIAESVE